jgi:hypothetical protein
VIRRWIGYASLLAALTACIPSSIPVAAEPSAIPSSPAIASLVASSVPPITPTPAPLTKATPAIVIEPSEFAATATASTHDLVMPPEKIVIYWPGPGSQVTSPFQVAGWGGPSYRDRVQVRLIGEDGRLLSEGISYLHVLPGNAGRFYSEVPFDIQLVAEAARLEIRNYSPRDQQLSHLSSVNLTLLTAGSPWSHPALAGPEKLAIFQPRQDAVISGGQVLVQGAGWVDSDVPLSVEVLDSSGEVVGSTQVALNAPAIGELGTFEVEVSYQVSRSQWGRIAVSEPSLDIPGLIHYSSVEVIIEP